MRPAHWRCVIGRKILVTINRLVEGIGNTPGCSPRLDTTSRHPRPRNLRSPGRRCRNDAATNRGRDDDAGCHGAPHGSDGIALPAPAAQPVDALPVKPAPRAERVGGRVAGLCARSSRPVGAALVRAGAARRRVFVGRRLVRPAGPNDTGSGFPFADRARGSARNNRPMRGCARCGWATGRARMSRGGRMTRRHRPVGWCRHASGR
jgi:hypothetical protein